MLVGYMRVSKADGSQVTDLQRDALLAAGVDDRHLYEDAEDQLAARGCRVDRGTMPGQHLEADAACGRVMHRIDRVPQVTDQAVELPDDERIAIPQRLEAGGQAGPVVPLAGNGVLVEVPRRFRPGGLGPPCTTPGGGRGRCR